MINYISEVNNIIQRVVFVKQNTYIPVSGNSK